MNGKSNTGSLASKLGEARGLRHANSHANIRIMRAEREPQGNETRTQIVESAERLFRKIGFQKPTVADIARELHMSSANIYRFFASKSEITEAVCMDLLGKIEAEAEEIVASGNTAAQKIRDLIGSVETTHHKQYVLDRNLYDLIEASITNKWAIMRQHRECMNLSRSLSRPSTK